MTEWHWQNVFSGVIYHGWFKINRELMLKFAPPTAFRHIVIVQVRGSILFWCQGPLNMTIPSQGTPFQKFKNIYLHCCSTTTHINIIRKTLNLYLCIYLKKIFSISFKFLYHQQFNHQFKGRERHQRQFYKEYWQQWRGKFPTKI